MKMKTSDFIKTHFFTIIFTFIYDFTLNSDNDIFFFEVLDCAGLCWPSLTFLAFVALDDFF